ncbi:MAG: hypothetical protein ACLQVY_29440 [Limisphaerales bacterium]
MHIASDGAHSSPLHEQQRLHAHRLLVAMAIILILAALLLPALSLGQVLTRNAMRDANGDNQQHTEAWTLQFHQCS